MIQRIQTIWLFIAFLFTLLIFWFPIYKTNDSILTVGNDFIAIILLVLSMGLSLITIFRFKHRKDQKLYTRINILINIALLAWFFYKINAFREEQLTLYNQEGYYWIGAFIPLITIIFLVLALAGVKKDEKLLRSLDRLR
ncbi:MAG TPA: DUF4293 domain-containing protein [Chitinophagaceae bacterium]|nr:DUF4293 domain-containing protein [Chitinophagaceae bacterium]